MTERFADRWSLPWLVEAFAVANLGFLAVDVALAHAVNSFALSDEWIPVVFSALAPLLLLPGLVGQRFQQTSGKLVGLGVGIASIVVGVAGLVFHLESSFFESMTLKSLVYAAPFVAPLSYVGLGLLLMVNRFEHAPSRSWAQWVVFLAFGGYVGNFVLSLTDHAQNGFFNKVEWVPVVCGAYGASFLLMAALGGRRRPFLRVTLTLMAVEALVGLTGSGLHLVANLKAMQTESTWDAFIYGAPVFAPLLFADLAALAALGILELERHAPDSAPDRQESPA